MSDKGAGDRDEGGDVAWHEETSCVHTHCQDDNKTDVEKVPLPRL